MSFFLEKKLHEKPCDYWLIYQLIQIEIQPKNISLEQICYKRSQGIALTSPPCLHHLGPQSLFFPSNVLKLTI